MNEATDSENLAAANGGVFASLPRTRPQRPSSRRASTAPSKARKPTSAAASKGTPAKARSVSRTAADEPAPAKEQPVPAQGFEPEGDLATGTPLAPPTGPELLASLAEVAGEMVQSSLSTGGRLLKDALSRL